MTVNFSKKAGASGLENAHMADAVEYSVFNGSEKTGWLFYSDRQSYFNYAQRVINLDVEKRMFGAPAVSLRDEITSEMIGQINKEGMTLHDKNYGFRRADPEVKYNLLKKNTWGHYKFILHSDEGQYIYSFKIDVPSVGFGSFWERNAAGTVEYNGNDLLPLIAGFFLIETALRSQND